MKGRKVVSPKALPTNLPVSLTVSVFLLLDRLNVEGWVWGAVSAFFTLIWVASIAQLVTHEQVDIFDKESS